MKKKECWESTYHRLIFYIIMLKTSYHNDVTCRIYITCNFPVSITNRICDR